MKILWISPNGDGWSIAAKLREAGNKVVYASDSLAGQHFLPALKLREAEGYVERADMVVCDGNFESRQTRRSWEPSDSVLQLSAAVKKRGVPYIGPLPTTELLENDRRYQAKILKRVGLTPTNVTSPVGVSVVLDPEGRQHTLLRLRHDGINMADLLLREVALKNRELQDGIGRLQDFLNGIGYKGHTALGLAIGADGDVKVSQVDTRFIYPSICSQWDLSTKHGEDAAVSLALTLLNLKTDSVQAIQPIGDLPGLFLRDVNREGEQWCLTGDIFGALVSTAATWDGVKDQMNLQLKGLLGRGLDLVSAAPALDEIVRNGIAILGHQGLL